MNKRILIDANFPTETRVVLLNRNDEIEDVEYSSVNKKLIKGNIYLVKVTRVEPALQAAFVDYGDEKAGFLPFSEIHPDYYTVLAKDKQESTPSWSELAPPEITSDDLSESSSASTLRNIRDNDELDISRIEKLVDGKIQSDFDIEASDSEIDNFGKEDAHHDTRKSHKIQEVIKKGQILLVQVTKEERGNKGVSMTTYISLAGKYCVLLPNKPSQNGISRKISNHDERKRLKEIISSLSSGRNNDTSSVIARTAAVGHTSLEIKKDYEYLAKLWNRIREATLKSKAPCFIHQEDGLILKTIRDMFDRNVKEIVVQGHEAFNACTKFMQDIMPNALSAIKEYKGTTPIFTKFRIEDQLTKLYQPIVYLPSGGYIVINPTEALISIDVNSGKATSERNIEEMALKNNLEAAKEIARQVKLRDLSGLLVIDFIDMSETRNRKIIERALREFLGKDKARIQTSNISMFGLLEMSRQRLRPSFLEINSNICSHCGGKGIVRAEESNAMLMLRTVENEIYHGNYDVVNVHAIASSILYLLNNKRREISFIEKKYSVKLSFHIDRDATADSYWVEKIRLSEKNKAETIVKQPVLQDDPEAGSYNGGSIDSSGSDHVSAVELATGNESGKGVRKERTGRRNRRKQRSKMTEEVGNVAPVVTAVADIPVEPAADGGRRTNTVKSKSRSGNSSGAKPPEPKSESAMAKPEEVQSVEETNRGAKKNTAPKRTRNSRKKIMKKSQDNRKNTPETMNN